MRILTLFGLFLALVHPALADEEFVKWPLGETTITIKVIDNGPGLTFFAPHENEQTSAAAAQNFVVAKGGRVVLLVHEGERNITFKLGGKTHAFDPNRMFTDAGIVASLKAQGKNYSDEALATVRNFAGVVLAYIVLGVGEGMPVVAMHNNTNGRYSIDSYLPGGEYDKEASYVFKSSKQDPDDFFFVTTIELYLPFRAARYNVALQNNAGMTDDGSLSVYAATQGIPYVNVEAEEGHGSIQAEMLKKIGEVL